MNDIGFYKSLNLVIAPVLADISIELTLFSMSTWLSPTDRPLFFIDCHSLYTASIYGLNNLNTHEIVNFCFFSAWFSDLVVAVNFRQKSFSAAVISVCI